MSTPRLLLALSIAVSISLPALAAEAPGGFWPQFHGPNRDNISAETGLLKAWPEAGPPRLWTAEGIGHGFSSLSIAEGLIYTAGNIEGNTAITALDLDGKIAWQKPIGPAWEKPVGGSRATPTFDGGRLYHMSPHGDLVCLDAKSGEKQWGFNVLKKYGSKPNQWGQAESVLVEGDVLYCRPGGPETCVVALKKLTGEVIWESPSAQGDLAAYSSMVLVEHQGLRMILSMTTGGMIGVRADGGDLLWRFPHKTPYDENIMTPVFHDGQVFFSTGFGRGSVMLKVTVGGQSASVEELWRNKDLDNHHGDVVLLDGYLYGSCWKPDSWTCLEWATGKTMYAGDEGIGKGSVTYADGLLYTVGEKTHEVGLVEPTPEGHRVVSRFKLPPGGSGPAWAHPVICGGRLYVRHGEFLYAYDVK